MYLGNFQGPIPHELSKLNPIEQTMISIYNAVSKISLHCGAHWHAKPTTYYIVNDLASVASKLPRMPTIGDMAILRHKQGLKHTDFQFQPRKVLEAIFWLKQNNFLFRDVELEWTPEIDWNSTEYHDPPFIPLSDEESKLIEASRCDSTHTAPSTNPGSRGQESNVLLATINSYVHSEDTLREVMNDEYSSVFYRTNNHEYAHPTTHSEYFWEKSFPLLFPYGRGGPSDEKQKHTKFGDFVKSMLNRGGGSNGRRFQNNPNFIFAAFTYQLRLKVGGVAARAAEYTERNEKQNATSAIDDVTVKSMVELINYLHDGQLDRDPTRLTPKVKDLLKRLTPFSKDLKG
jgi:hypothetical protein